MGVRDRPTRAASAAAVAALKRKPHAMPSPVRLALEAHELLAAYLERPEFQRNDYLGWIARARRDDTRGRRLQQMLDELMRGDCYMSMAWRPRRPTA